MITITPNYLFIFPGREMNSKGQLSILADAAILRLQEMTLDHINQSFQIQISENESEIIVSREKFEALIPYIIEHRDDINDMFTLRDRSGKETNQYKIALVILKKLYKKWCNRYITVNNMDYNKKAIDYKFVKINN